MYTNLWPGAVGLSLKTAEEQIDLAARAGFGGLDFPVTLVPDEAAAEKLTARAQDSGLRWGLMPMPVDFLRTEDPAAFAEGLRRLEAQLPRAQAAGVTLAYNHIWPGSDDRPWDANRAWHQERIGALSDLLSRYGVRYALEFLGTPSFRARHQHAYIYTLGETHRLAQSIGPNVGILVDFFHFHNSGSTLAELEAALADGRVWAVHANDSQPVPVEEQIDNQRAMPGETGVIDAAGIVARLKAGNFDGPVTCEPFKPATDRFRELPPLTVANEVRAALDKVLQV